MPPGEDRPFRRFMYRKHASKICVFVSATCSRRYLQTVDRAHCNIKKGEGRLYSITERRVPELIPVLGSQPAGDVSHKPGGRLPLFSAMPAVTLATRKSAATSFAAW